MERRLAKDTTVDPEMLKNLDLLMDYEALDDEESWATLQDLKDDEDFDELSEGERLEKEEAENE